jgi:hypothetical protein
METLLKLRISETEEELEAFHWFFGDFMECVCAKRVWGIQKYQEVISKANDPETGFMIVTTSDEAFGLLMIENYRDKWIRKAEAAKKGEVPRSGERFPEKYTNSKLGNSQYAGWTKKGLDKFNLFFDLVGDDRREAMAHGNVLEENFLTQMRETQRRKSVSTLLLAQRESRPSDPAGLPSADDTRIDMSW